jgi:hypothetical protein
MTRKEISLFLKNVPGELGRLTLLLKESGINIEAITIQDASAYVTSLFNARGKALKRIASTASYQSLMKDSKDFALVRLVVDQTEKTADLLAGHNYLFEIRTVVALYLENKPGSLAEVASKLGEHGINIDYVYGSAFGPAEKCLFVFNPDDVEGAERVFSS